MLAVGIVVGLALFLGVATGAVRDVAEVVIGSRSATQDRSEAIRACGLQRPAAAPEGSDPGPIEDPADCQEPGAP